MGIDSNVTSWFVAIDVHFRTNLYGDCKSFSKRVRLTRLPNVQSADLRTILRSRCSTFIYYVSINEIYRRNVRGRKRRLIVLIWYRRRERDVPEDEQRRTANVQIISRNMFFVGILIVRSRRKKSCYRPNDFHSGISSGDTKFGGFCTILLFPGRES